ncbi:MAG: DUF1934 domain-containing protein [Clostridiales bacterium]|nr:DUF1934 domain-containing protein [Clostridiales bacterium]
MQKIPVLITLNSNAYRDNEADEPVTMITYGTLSIQGEKYTVDYDETLDENLPAQHVSLILEGDSMIMNREGDYSTQMIFTRGGRYEGQYFTPYGTMELAVFCNRLKWELSENGGSIALSYQMDIGGQFAATHEMSITMFAHNG